MDGYFLRWITRGIEVGGHEQQIALEEDVRSVEERGCEDIVAVTIVLDSVAGRYARSKSNVGVSHQMDPMLVGAATIGKTIGTCTIRTQPLVDLASGFRVVDVQDLAVVAGRR